MGADARHAALVEDHDLIGVTDRADPLGDDQHRRVLRLRRQGVAQGGVVLKVQGGEAVVEVV